MCTLQNNKTVNSKKRRSLKGTVCAAMFAALANVALAAGPAYADGRVALVIGNSGYRGDAALTQPKADAQTIASGLRGAGFKVHRGIDTDHVALQQLISRFTSDAKGADVALFYYAGHALQLEGKNLLVPVDADLGARSDLPSETVRLQSIIKQVQKSAEVTVIALDASRANPAYARLSAGAGNAVVPGLAKVKVADGGVVIASAQPGAVTRRTGAPNSRFARALKAQISRQGGNLDLVINRVREQVAEESAGRQVPWVNARVSLDKVIVNPRPAAAAKVTIVEPAATEQAEETVTVTPATVHPDVELAFWNSVVKSKDPALFEAYLKRFPDGNFVLLAQAFVDQLRTQKGPVVNEQDMSKPAEEPKTVKVETPRLAGNPHRPVMDVTFTLAPPADELAIRNRAIAVEPAAAVALAPVTVAPVTVAAPAAPATSAEPAQVTQPATPDLSVAKATPARATPRELILTAQRQLQRLGCYSGRADGFWGRKSRAAIRTFAKQAGIEISARRPDAVAVRTLKLHRSGLCAKVVPVIAKRETPAKTAKATTTQTKAAPVAAKPGKKIVRKAPVMKKRKKIVRRAAPVRTRILRRRHRMETYGYGHAPAYGYRTPRYQRYNRPTTGWSADPGCPTCSSF